jgi:hypothetical protein
MDQPEHWTCAVVEILATDAWIPVDDASSIKEFAADKAYAVHHIQSPAPLVELLQRPHAGTVRAARELLGMLPAAHFAMFMGHLTGKAPVVPRIIPIRVRKGRRRAG